MWLQKDAGNSVVSPRRVPVRSVPVRGARVSNQYGPLSGRGFSNFQFALDGQSDPYELTERARCPSSSRGPQQAVLHSMSPRPVFKHSALPQAPAQAGSFQCFRYSMDPYERKEDLKRTEVRHVATRQLGGSFLAGGSAKNEKRSLRRRLPELREQLKRSLRSDWPSFMGIGLDERGVLMVAFDSEQLDGERHADLHTYMGRMLDMHPASREFNLQKDPTRWGVIVAAVELAEMPPVGASVPSEAVRNSERIIYALRPPWVPNDLLLAHRLVAPQGPMSQLAHLAMAEQQQSELALRS